MGRWQRSLENMGMSWDFWRGKSALITGHTGFKGAWLSQWLTRLGANVTGYSVDVPTNPALFCQLQLKDRVQHIFGDIRDLDHLHKSVDIARPDVVFHMAAQPLVRQSYETPLETYSTNVIGTANLLEVCRQKQYVRAIVVVTTDKCYENKEWIWGYRENEPLGGHDIYSSSKACAELVTHSYVKSFFALDDILANVASARSGNVIGGGDWAKDRLIPDAVRALQSNRTLMIRNPDSIRPWQHVLEPLYGYMRLAELLCSREGASYCEPWNFGPRQIDAKPVHWLLDMITAHWNGKPRWATDETSSHHEAKFLKLDCSKAEARLGWQPTLSLSEALKLTADWYSALTRGVDLIEVTNQQIDIFMQNLTQKGKQHACL